MGSQFNWKITRTDHFNWKKLVYSLFRNDVNLLDKIKHLSIKQFNWKILGQIPRLTKYGHLSNLGRATRTIARLSMDGIRRMSALFKMSWNNVWNNALVRNVNRILGETPPVIGTCIRNTPYTKQCLRLLGHPSSKNIVP